MPSFHRIVVRSPNWLGDAVMSLPAVQAVRRHFAAARLTVAAPEPLADIFRAAPDVAADAVLALSPESGHGHWRREAAALRAGRFDLAILLPNSFRTALAVRAAGIPERWGYRSDFRSWMLTRAVRRPRRRVIRHQAAYYVELVRALGIPPVDARPRVVADPAIRARAEALLERHGAGAADMLVGIAPGAAYGQAKQWPPARVAELAIRLSAERAARCVLVGSAGDRPAGHAIESAVAGRARLVNLIGQTDLPTLIGLMACCRAFVSNDSGAMHLAAAAGLPVTAIFGPTDERATAPLGEREILASHVWCRPCHLRECPIDHRCMKRITAARVFESVTRYLNRQSSGVRA